MAVNTPFSQPRMATNPLYVIKGELALIISHLRRGNPNQRWSSNQNDQKQDPLLKKLQTLKEALESSSTSHHNSAAVKLSTEANFFLLPFLDVIRSEDTSGPVTILALSAVEKFVASGVINEQNGTGGAVEAITDAVIHAHFVSTDSASDEIVLMKILQVLHRVFMSPLGCLLSNESVCELMQSCFRMCFVEKANELLRKSAESALVDMIRLLFNRLRIWPDYQSSKSKSKSKSIATSLSSIIANSVSPSIVAEANVTPSCPSDVEQNPSTEILASTSQSNLENSTVDCADGNIASCQPEVEDTTEKPSATENTLPCIKVEEATPDSAFKKPKSNAERGEFRNRRGIKFTSSSSTDLEESKSERIIIPYGVPCVRELFRFLISLINPYEKQNTELMIHLGLKLILVTMETGIDAINRHSSLNALVKNELLKNLLSLLSIPQGAVNNQSITSNSTLLLNVMRILLIVFEQMRSQVKFQVEVAIAKLHDIIGDANLPASQNQSSNQQNSKWSYEQREIALSYLVEIWKLPCFITELYLNYDCDLFCQNLFEDTTKLFSKNAFPMSSGLNTVHLLCLDGLSSVLDGIENHCCQRMTSANPNVSSSSDDSSNNSVFFHEDSSMGFSNTTTNVFPLRKDIELGEEKESCVSESAPKSPLPTHEELMAVRRKKKIVHTGSEQFNTNAKKGIEFLQNNGLLNPALDSKEVATFLRDNPLLDKQAIGDYVSAKKNHEILRSFVKSFDFRGLRVDEALRIFLETFRLPGEAPLISHILEEFAEHWSLSNNNPFANVDAAFTLSYAIIMLNVDQHNSNVKRQGNSMTWEQFKKNLKGVNGGSDFDADMLQEMYNAIKQEEIVMPAERTGVVKENYIWKVLLRRAALSKNCYLKPSSDEGGFDHDLFSLAWGPIVAALSFVFDKTSNDTVIAKCLVGFRKCATIAAHYGMSDVFDNLVTSLCKFTSLVSSGGQLDLASNEKAQQSCLLMFQLVHKHGGILREGWSNFVECLIALFNNQHLPRILTESEDFTEPSGRISLIRQNKVLSAPRVETGILSSIYSYIALSSASSTGDSPGGGSKGVVSEEEENRKKIQLLLKECQPELLLSESKFLPIESLNELIKSLIYASPPPDVNKKNNKDYDEDVVVFVMEVLLKIVIQNRDRALLFWEPVKEHLFGLILAAASGNEMPFLLERSVVGLLRVALRLMRKEDLCPVILKSLSVLLYLKPVSVVQLSQQMSFGLHETLKTTAANIHTSDEWSVIFSILEYVGAGKIPALLINGPPPLPATSSPLLQRNKPSVKPSKDTLVFNPGQLQHSHSQDPILTTSGLNVKKPASGYWSSSDDRGYTSDSELEVAKSSSANELRGGSPQNVSPAQSWILLTTQDEAPAPANPSLVDPVLTNKTSISENPQLPQAPTSNQPVERQLFFPDPKALIKSCETLSFLVRDAAHITPDNFTLCVTTIRSYVEASIYKPSGNKGSGLHTTSKKRGRNKRHGHEQQTMSKSKSFSGSYANSAYDADYESDSEMDKAAASQQVCIQLLDLLHTLHTRAAQIFQWWQKEQESVSSEDVIKPSIWSMGWQPILQTIGLLCSDNRKQVRTCALTYLQRALLVHDLQQLSPLEWHSCFKEVLFPLMDRLLEPLNPNDPSGIEETRMRAATLLCKVFLQHLSPLLLLEELFTPLWLQILNYMDGYMHCTDTKNELLGEAIPESLKNLLLVMETAGVFHTPDGYTRLWALTWEKIDSFLPHLRAEVLRTTTPAKPPQQLPRAANNVATEESLPNPGPGANNNIVDSVSVDNKGVSLENPRIQQQQFPINSPLWMNSAEPSGLPFVVANGSYVPSPTAPMNVSECNTSGVDSEPCDSVQEKNLQGSNEGALPLAVPLAKEKEGEMATQSYSCSPTSQKNEYTSIMFEVEDDIAVVRPDSDNVIESPEK